MASTITHNISAVNTQRNLTINNRNLSKSLEKLSSGYRINVGADGPADLVISEQLRAQTSGLERAVRNTEEAINVLGIAEGALNEVNEILKKMRALALHASNNGITSTVQVAADQQEVDSGIQTIDRIANTTKFSNQFLLNGAKGINYSLKTSVFSTQQNSLVNQGLSTVDQIFKREGFGIDITFVGTSAPNATSQVGDANVLQQAKKAYFEIDNANGDNDIDATTGTLTKQQEFILTGTKGSRLFRFDAGATMGQIATAIGNVADSTGIDANLIFASGQTNNSAYALGATVAYMGGTGAVRTSTTLAVFNNQISAAGKIVTNISVGFTGVIVGQNTDGLGRIFLKVTSNTSYELYKDESLSAESLIGHGTEGSVVIRDNNSGLSSFTIATGGLTDNQSGKVIVFGVNGIAGTQASTVRYSGALSDTLTAANYFQATSALLSGVQLGKNTDGEGKIYLKVTMTSTTQANIYAYKDSRMSDEDLVAKALSNTYVNSTNLTVNLSEVRSTDQKTGTGLGIAISSVNGFAGVAGDTFTGTIQFTRLGVRIASQEYGSDQLLRIQQNTGRIWQYYKQPDSATYTLVDPGASSTTVEQYGSDATMTVNGSKVTTRGLMLEIANQDLKARIQLNEGRVGSTTMAQVGYMEGSVYSRAQILTNTSTASFDSSGAAANGTDVVTGLGGVLFNAGHVTTNRLDNFTGGMQLQLGEGSGDQERTVVGVQSMAVANIGQSSFTDRFEKNSAVIQTKTLSLQDVLGGGAADLTADPVKALTIIDKAIADVANQRARMGATTSNLLQTNANTLRVAIENITKTESAIRDTDMASETTEFTKNQILVSAATSMLGQANVASQNVLQLLG